MRSFRNRLLVLIIGLVVVTQTVTLFAVSASMAASVKTRAASQLHGGTALVQQFVRFRGNQLAGAVRVLAADFGFREAVASRDRDTILSALDNHGQRIRADISILVDPSGHVVAATTPVDAASSGRLTSLVEERRSPRERARFLTVNGRPYQFLVAPVRTPETIAWVAMGFAVDDALAREIRELVGAEVTLLVPDAVRPAPVASTLDAALRGELAERVAENGLEPQTEPRDVDLSGAAYLATVQPLDATGEGMWVALTVSMHEAMAPFREVRTAIALIGGSALLLAIIVSVRLGRGATRPIDRLVAGARRIEEGDYTRRISVSGGEEFARLATTLNAMQEGIAEREARITHDAHHDALTGLPNRALAQQRLGELVANLRGIDLRSQAARARGELALILLDLTSLREIHASLGHEVGDQVLLEISRRLGRHTRPGDFIARLSATQFLVAVPDCSREYAQAMAGKLCELVRTGVPAQQLTLDLDVAAGLCFAPEHGRDPAELLRRAEVALQDARDRNCRLGLFEPARDLERRRRLALVTDLRDAIQNDALSLMFQPKALMATHRVTGAEALVRWTHPVLGPVSPAEFVPLAEQAGTSRPLTRWVLRNAVRQMSRWRREGFQLDIAVNLSAPDLVDPELVPELLAELEAGEVAPTSLVLEITESAVMRDFAVATQNMQLLQVAGIRFAIDDFGTGHSSLSQLQRLPVDELKIDKSFVRDANERADDAAIVRSTIELAHSMGLKVVAEGVETGPVWELLVRYGCDLAQGYFLSRPLPADELAAFVRAANARLADANSATAQVRVLEEFRGAR